MNYEDIRVLLVNGADRQTLPMAKAFKHLGCKVTTLNSSRLDNGYVSKYLMKKYLIKTFNNKEFEKTLKN